MEALDKDEVSISAAAAVASLPVAEQQKIVAAGHEAVKEAAKAIRETKEGRHRAGALRPRPRPRRRQRPPSFSPATSRPSSLGRTKTCAST